MYESNLTVAFEFFIFFCVIFLFFLKSIENWNRETIYRYVKFTIEEKALVQ